MLFALITQISFGQEKTISGVVKDNEGLLPGVTIKNKTTKKAVATDFDGKFSLKASEGDMLEFSFVGFKTKSFLVAQGDKVDVTLVSDVKLIEEVVIQGYRTVSKKSAVVSSAAVSNRTIENRPNANAINTLQGQLAGVNITASSGQPGDRPQVVIRGVGSIGGNTDPLYVIDGFPSNSDTFRTLNSNDIASAEVLKDAAAISEYGSRGANGVIVITTRNASFGEQKTKYSYSSTFGTAQLQNQKYSFSNSRELLKIEQNFGSGLGATLSDAQISSYGINTDWVKYFFTTGFSNSHNFSVESTGKNINSFTSLGYLKQDGTLKSTGLQRFTLRNNINGKSQNEKFKYSVRTAIGFAKDNQATNLGGGAINRNYVTGAFLGAPYISPDEYQNSTQVFNLYNTSGTLLYTPLFLIDKLKTYDNLTEDLKLNLGTEFSYKLSENFTARMRTSAEMNTQRFAQGEQPISFNAFLFLATGQQFGGFEDINQRRELLLNNFWSLEFKKSISKHSFGANINAEYNQSRLNTNNIRQRGLNPKTYVFNTGAGYLLDVGTNDFNVPLVSASQLRNDLISYFASADYDYNKKYGIVGTYRIDGSSRFIGDKQFGNFWSVGARWNLEEEDFIKKLKFIDVLKLRGSIGTVGNQRIVAGTVFAGINPPAFADIYQNSNNAYNGGQGYNINFGYPELRWETTKIYNFGLDFEMFKGRLRGSFDRYNKKTIDLFIREPVVPAVGVNGNPTQIPNDLQNAITKNSDAIVTNEGYELNIAFDLIKNANTSLTIRGNGSYNKNSVDGIRTNNGKILRVANGNTFITQNGGQIDENYAYPYLGVNPANGNLLFQDILGNKTENPLATDRVATGKNYLPVYQGGFGFDFSYKGFFISTTFTFAQKVWRYDTDLANLYDVGNIGTFVVTNDLLNAWTPTNTTSNVPSLTATNYASSVNSDRFIRDASYVRLRNAQIGYRVPKKFLSNTFIKDLGFTLQGENIFNITKWMAFDPESNRNEDVYQYPTPKIFTFGLDLKF